MSKVTNKNENYCTRSKISNKCRAELKEYKTDRELRNDFSVDVNGYFVWAPSPAKKI